MCVIIIHICITNNINNNIINDNLVMIIWDKFTKFYRTRSLTNKLYLKYIL